MNSKTYRYLIHLAISAYIRNQMSWIGNVELAKSFTIKLLEQRKELRK